MQYNRVFHPQRLFQYATCFVLVSCVGALWFEKFMIPTLATIWVIYLTMVVMKSSMRKGTPLLISAFLLFIFSFIRLMTSGGIGITDWLIVTGQILIVYIAIYSDPKNAIRCFVNVCLVMCVISLPFYLIQLLNPNLLASILPANVWGDHTVHGMWLYVYRPYNLVVEANRNNGIFTEPGRFQVLCIAALFLMLFYKENIGFTPYKYLTCITILILTLLSTGSTTGFVSLAILFAGYIPKRGRNLNQTKMTIVTLIFVTVAILLFEYSIAGTDSILGRYLFVKLINTDIDDVGSSGGARLRMIAIVCKAIFRYPLGAGQQYITDQITVYNTAGAGLIRFIGAIGVLPSLILFRWIMKPLMKKGNFIVGLCLLLIYINTGLAQTYAIYSPFLFITVMHVAGVASSSRESAEHERLRKHRAYA